jgi:ribosomal protein S18 acetylase RimI-like enzyme
MAQLSHAAPCVRAPRPGEGTRIALLWRELWEVHERWGGYPGSREGDVYAQLASRLDSDATVRAKSPTLGRHVHLVADLGGVLTGQVEGWLDHHGTDGSTPATCEVRSLIVGEYARRLGVGRALLEALAVTARRTLGARCTLAAEVLEHNPARAFYTRMGYAPVSWNARIDTLAQPAPGPVAARLAAPQDALPIARLEAALADRRRAAGDVRFDRPRALDATLVGAIAALLANEGAAPLRDPTTLVAVDSGGVVRGAASFTVHTLQAPFLPVRRALMARLAVDPACPAQPLVAPLMALACRLAAAQRVQHVEVTDLSAPASELHEAVLATGARAWSLVVTRSC